MGGITESVSDLWARLRIRRYRAKQADAAAQDRASEQRRRMAEEGIDPYPRAAGGF